MPAAAHCRVNTSAVYWLPRSECNTTPCAARAVTAIPSADCTRATVWRALMAQPTTFRLNTSSTVAKYTNPSSVGTYVMSATHKRFGPRPRNGAGPGPAPRPLARPCGSCNAASAVSPPASPAPASAAPPAAATPSRPVPAAPPTPGAPRRSAATRRGSPRSVGSTPCSAAPADSATAPATRNTRWWRPPANGTCRRSDSDPDSLLRIRTPLAGRIGLPSEPGRCL